MQMARYHRLTWDIDPMTNMADLHVQVSHIGFQETVEA